MEGTCTCCLLFRASLLLRASLLFRASLLLCLIGSIAGQSMNLGSSQALCNILTAIPCGFVTVDDPSMAPDPSTYEDLPMHCNPICKERMSAGSCSALFQDYLLSCASLKCATDLASQCGMQGTDSTAEPDAMTSSSEYVTFDTDLMCSDQCGVVLSSGPCSDLTSTNGYDVMDSYRERLGPEGSDCQKLQCMDALLSACGWKSLSDITEMDICLLPECKAVLEGDICSGTGLLITQTGLDERCKRLQCETSISSTCFPDNILKKYDLCSSQCLEAIGAEAACSSTDYELYSTLLCSEPPECGTNILSACNITFLPLQAQGACTYGCKASFSITACDNSQLDLSSLEDQMAAYCVDGYEWGGGDGQIAALQVPQASLAPDVAEGAGPVASPTEEAPEAVPQTESETLPAEVPDFAEGAGPVASTAEEALGSVPQTEPETVPAEVPDVAEGADPVAPPAEEIPELVPQTEPETLLAEVPNVAEDAGPVAPSAEEEPDSVPETVPDTLPAEVPDEAAGAGSVNPPAEKIPELVPQIVPEAPEFVPQTVPETLQAECTIDTMDASCSAAGVTAPGSLDSLATSPFCSAGCKALTSTPACSDPAKEWTNSQGFSSQILSYQNYLCTCANLAVNTCGGFQDQQQLPPLGNSTQVSLSSDETQAINISTASNCKAVVVSSFCDVPSLPSGVGTSFEGELTILISTLRAKVESTYPADLVPASTEDLILFAEQILSPEEIEILMGDVGNVTQVIKGLDPGLLEGIVFDFSSSSGRSIYCIGFSSLLLLLISVAAVIGTI